MFGFVLNLESDPCLGSLVSIGPNINQEKCKGHQIGTFQNNLPDNKK